MNQIDQSITHEFIEQLIASKNNTVVITVNGFQMDCIIVNQDDMSIVIRRGASESLLFKHAISTIRRGRLPDHKD